MIERDLELTLHDLAEVHVRHQAPANVREDARLVPLATSRRRSWVPRPGARLQSMVSATKLALAGATVAIFGGFLLAVVLTQQPDDRLPAVGASYTTQAEPADSSTPEPTTEAEADGTSITSDLLPGVDLVTEELVPGVYQVLRDTAGHDLVAEPPRALLFAPDGRLVLFADGPEQEDWPLGVGSVERFYALGQAGESALDLDGYVTSHLFFDAAIDGHGNLFAALETGQEPNRLVMFDGEERRQLSWPNGTSNVSAIETAPDGTVFVTKHNRGSGPRVARIEDGVLSVLPVLDDGSRASHTGSQIAIAPDRTIWVANLDIVSPVSPETKGLVYFDGETWREPDLPLPAEPRTRQFGPMAIGPDGTLWVYVVDSGGVRSRTLLRLSDGEWSAFTGDDEPPQMWAGQGWVSGVAVGNEGTLWIAQYGDSYRGLPRSLRPSEWPHGLLAFDGTTWRQYLAGHLVNRVEVDENGSVWATSLAHCADEQGRECRRMVDGGLFVVTPEAVAASEPSP